MIEALSPLGERCVMMEAVTRATIEGFLKLPVLVRAEVFISADEVYLRQTRRDPASGITLRATWRPLDTPHKP